MAIPLIAIPVLNRPDLLAECVASIDAAVERLLIIDNSPDGEMGDVAEAHLPPNVAELFVSEPPSNLGYTASVNFAIKTAPGLPFWMVANADTRFAPGDLDRIASLMDGPAWVGIVDWRVFGLTAEAVDLAGYWDENFFNYCSDADYEHRCALAGVEVVRLDGETTHVGSVCYQGDARNAANNARSYPLELAYYSAKWGGGLRGGEAFATPFDRGGSVADWTGSRQRLAALAWR